MNECYFELSEIHRYSCTLRFADDMKAVQTDSFGMLLGSFTHLSRNLSLPHFLSHSHALAHTRLQ